MRALTVTPLEAGSLALSDVPEPDERDGTVLVEGLALGVCGTDREIADGAYGWAPHGRDRLVIGHESLGRVLEAPAGSGLAAGDLVAGVVRRPDPVPCGACARGRFDMCRNGEYTERGIKEIDGFGSERWRIEPDYAVHLDPALASTGVLLEPASVVAKAWDQIELVGNRSWFEPKRVLVTGAGPIGLLAALLGAQRGLDVHVLDLVTDGLKPELVRALGATYHSEPVGDVAKRLQPDVIVEATGVGSVVMGAMGGTAPYGIVCLTGTSTHRRRIPVDANTLNHELVLDNDVVIGSVNAGLEHWADAAQALVRADADWLEQLITRRVPLGRALEAFEPHDDDVKVVVDLTA